MPTRPRPAPARTCRLPPRSERSGTWDTSGLQGPALHLVGGDRDAANWLGKLEVVNRLLVDNGGCRLACAVLLCAVRTAGQAWRWSRRHLVPCTRLHAARMHVGRPLHPA